MQTAQDSNDRDAAIQILVPNTTHLLQTFAARLEESMRVAGVNCFKSVDASVRLPNGAVLRCYQVLRMGQPPVLVLQRIVNPGVSDKRLKEWKRERREELCQVPGFDEAIKAAKAAIERQ
jgi:hypothetical protein